ncbi:hypothetical protein F5Y18DRAFT_132046 [Xylariaceae sp. FL1019]|nr:hypothetical protein F5Y18DRAFT_132046 [Xylariaceae sp. FL1019]
MASFGKIQGSVASFTNENTAALISVNLDFSLFRCQANPEYAPIGTALTIERRKEAEDGQTHRIACTLGFLFQEMLTDTSALLQAYGRRATDILEQPNINPRGTTNDGPFKKFVGADCTSIWAAATSSDSSIAIHLLACLLARAFDAKTATSIWVEIVKGRQQQIEQLLRDSKMVHPNTYAASRQAIGRSDLANWDASVRAWLRRADESKAWERHQLALIADNLNLPFTSMGTTYNKVIASWMKSMKVIDDLLRNLPQQANDRAVLLALSSWHLYPNLLVFQNTATKVDLKDPLFSSSSILSLGLEYNSHKSVANTQWSLALSHLRYYGDPVMVQSNADVARVTMSQFWYVALGVLLRTWEIRMSETSEAIEWLAALGKLLSSFSISTTPELSWVLSFCTAAQRLLDSDENGRSIGMQLVKFGSRRGCRLFADNPGDHLPYLGLRDPDVLEALEVKDVISKGFRYLRSIVTKHGVDATKVLLSFKRKIGQETFFEWATVQPPPADRLVQDARPSRQCRWIYFNTLKGLTRDYREKLEARRKSILALGEDCEIIWDISDAPQFAEKRANYMFWQARTVSMDSSEILKHKIRYYQFAADIKYDHAHEYGIWQRGQAGDWRFTPTNTTSMEKSRAFLQREELRDTIFQYVRASANPFKPRVLREQTMEETPELNKMHHEFPSFEQHERTLLIHKHQPSATWISSVVILQIATLIYDQLPGATISLRLVELQLGRSRWLPEAFGMFLDTEGHEHGDALSWLLHMTRAQAFGCIAMFESGRLNIATEHLADVVALCTEDSIFVSEIMLRDPSNSSEQGPRIRHMVGSIGQPGLVLLVSPLDPRVRRRTYDPTVVEHKTYDGNRINSFTGVSIHLSFTEWKMPLDWENTGEIDQEVFLLESVVSVMHHGQWVGDIDVLGLEKTGLDIFETDCTGDCRGKHEELPPELISIDNWEELLDPPPAVGVFRAKSNWVARLAVASILIQQGNEHSALIIGPRGICWNCLFSHYSDPEPHIPQIIID